MSKLLKLELSPNIITIFDHGWIESPGFYFIDMELCESTLSSYFDYLRDGSSLGFGIDDRLAPVVVDKESALSMRMQNIWTIGIHIARGLEFLHAQRIVHRDLKPANGIIRQR